MGADNHAKKTKFSYFLVRRHTIKYSRHFLLAGDSGMGRALHVEHTPAYHRKYYDTPENLRTLQNIKKMKLFQLSFGNYLTLRELRCAQLGEYESESRSCEPGAHTGKGSLGCQLSSPPPKGGYATPPPVRTGHLLFQATQRNLVLTPLPPPPLPAIGAGTWRGAHDKIHAHNPRFAVPDNFLDATIFNLNFSDENLTQML